MADDATSDVPVSAGFSRTFRGYSPGEVDRRMRELTDRLVTLEAERDHLALLAGDHADRDLQSEIAAVTTEIGEVLETARRAAETMRERAAADAARWRSEAMAAAEAEGRRARSDAEHLRGDAWTTSEEMLKQSQREAANLVAQAEKDSLTIRGEAERDAHRITTAARREAEEVLRTSRMEAERLSVDSQAGYDEIIESARRQAEAAQERTRALEQRRDELMTEIESVRATLSKMEGELDERRETMGLSKPVDVPEPKVVQPQVPLVPDGGWALGETVRIVPAEPFQTPGEPEPVDAEDLASEVARLQDDVPTPVASTDLAESDDTPPSVAPPEASPPASSAESDASPAATEEILDIPEVRPEAPVSDEVDAEEESEPDDEPAATGEPHVAVVSLPEPQPAESEEADLDTLFAALREPAQIALPVDEPEADSSGVADEETDEPEAAGVVEADEMLAQLDLAPTSAIPDPFELRDQLLLPVSNRALRNLKRQLTDVQNGALEDLRLDEKGWQPDPEAIRDRIKADLVVLAAESFGVGHRAAEAMAGHGLSRPATPRSEVDVDFARSLAGAVAHVVGEGRAAGEGARQIGAAVSRVFRGWRTDEAERRVRDLALSSYHSGMVAALRLAGTDQFTWMVAGRGCAQCRAAADEAPAEPPPLHTGCSCTVVPVSVPSPT